MKNQQTQNVKQGIVTALKLFYSSREKLAVVDHNMSGRLWWWKGRSEKDCINVESFWSDEEIREEYERKGHGGSNQQEEPGPEDHDDHKPRMDHEVHMQAVSLGAAKTGKCVGLFHFPRLDLWTLEFIVTKRDPSLDDQGSPHDYVTIRLGDSTKTLNTVGTFFNVLNEDTLSIAWEVTFQIKSKSLAYSFEFNSSTIDPSIHMVVLPAFYSTRPVPDLEEVGDKHVISSFVKYLRVQMAKGTLRNERLLEELVAAEASDQEYWDSDVLVNYPQR